MPEEPTLIHPFNSDYQAAIQVTAGAMGVDINDQTQVNSWLPTPVTTTQQVMTLMRNYHKAVIRPELYNMVTQLETAVKAVDDRVCRVRREMEWMCCDNRASQRHASGLQVLTLGGRQDSS